MKKLNEVVEIVGLKRRAIQEYEDAELAIKPTEKNKYGHLLYDSQAIERLWRLRFYKELGYSRTEIEKIFDDASYDEQKEMGKIISKLEMKRDQLNDLISIAQMMKETGLSFNALRKGGIGFENVKADNVFSILASGFNAFNVCDWEKVCGSILTEEDYENLVEEVENIMEMFGDGESTDSQVVQEGIKSLHGIMAKVFSWSMIVWKSSLTYLEPGEECARELSEEYGEERYIKMCEALRIYCNVNENNPVDNALVEAFDNIEKYGREKYTTKSKEVQAEVERIHNYFREIPAFSKESLVIMRKLGQNYGSPAFRDEIDNGAERGLSWFISRAIEIYCDSIDEKSKSKVGEDT